MVPARGPLAAAVADDLDNGLWACPACATAIAGARERIPPRLLRAWAAEGEREAARRRPPLPDVRVRRWSGGEAGATEVVVVNRGERIPLGVELTWQWPERVVAVQTLGAAAAEAAAPEAASPFRTTARVGPGQALAVVVRSEPAAALVELLAPGDRHARTAFGRGVAHFELEGTPRCRTFVVPLDYDARRRELTSVAVDDDVARWNLRARVW